MVDIDKPAIQCFLLDNIEEVNLKHRLYKDEIVFIHELMEVDITIIIAKYCANQRLNVEDFSQIPSRVATRQDWHKSVEKMCKLDKIIKTMSDASEQMKTKQ